MLIATPDLTTHDPDRGPGLVELKCVNRYRADEWQDDPPLAYQIQLQQQLYVATSVGLARRPDRRQPVPVVRS